MAEKVVIGNAELWHGDCREILPTLPECDLILTDPPYGIGANKAPIKGKWGSRIEVGSDWDNKRPDPCVFHLIQEKSKEQIIWGGNYFADLLPATMRWLVWDKELRGFSLADCELAWTSQNKAARVFCGNRQEIQKDIKEHPTQKPVRLMIWCLDMHKEAETVCDPFMGSGTTGVACANIGKKFVGIERERKYFDIACERIRAAQAQERLFA